MRLAPRLVRRGHRELAGLNHPRRGKQWPDLRAVDPTPSLEQLRHRHAEGTGQLYQRAELRIMMRDSITWSA
jgi:hypothetical protein